MRTGFRGLVFIPILLAHLEEGCAAAGDPNSPGTGGNDTPTRCTSAAECEGLDGPCVEGACVDGACEGLPSNELGACDDGLFCTVDDTCQSGTCIGAGTRFCGSPSDCLVGACDEANDACASSPGNEGATCDDNDPCTLTGTCNAGECTGAPPVDCAVLDSPCTEGLCDPALGCVPVPANEAGSCGEVINTDCMAGECMNGKCVLAPTNDGKACDDGLYCTVGEVCVGGQCVGVQPRVCPSPSACRIGECDEALKTCVSDIGNEGASCDDDSPCTTGTFCMQGVCTGGSPTHEGMLCDDGFACTSGEICQEGACVATTEPKVYFFDRFSSNVSNWKLGAEWQIGPAKTSFGAAFGSDPEQDHSSTTDDGVAGVAIGGNASTMVHPFHYLESPAFDTSSTSGPLVLSFYRWLNSDSTPHMDNVVEVWNGSAWVTLWSSGPPPRVQDSPPIGSGWTFVQYDLSAHKNAKMRLRFGVSVTSTPLKVGSWSIDDVMVGDVACP